jgi:large subunit ribosomal protein L10
MPNIVNESITREYETRLKGDLDALFVQPVGMDVEDSNAFRGLLEEQNLRMQLLKGSLARRVLEAKGHANVGGFFAGPAALITVADGAEVEGAAIAASRVLKAWYKDSGINLPAVKGGIMEGEVLDEGQAIALAKLPTKEAMQAILLGQILSPAAKLSGQMIAGGAAIAGAVKAHMDKLESGES